MGRPSDFSQDLADCICSRLAEGLSLRTVCKADDMPDKSTVFKWLREIPGFSDQYAKAKEEAADALFEETIDIADDGSNDWIKDNDPENPGYKFNGEHYQRSRLRVDTRKWMLSKMKPKKYGEKVTQEISGPNGGPVAVTQIGLAAL
jgi:hypothetical protein